MYVFDFLNLYGFISYKMFPTTSLCINVRSVGCWNVLITRCCMGGVGFIVVCKKTLTSDGGGCQKHSYSLRNL